MKKHKFTTAFTLTTKAQIRFQVAELIAAGWTRKDAARMAEAIVHGKRR